MTAEEIVAEIEPQGSESYRKILRNHGAQDPVLGVKIEYLKKIEKRVKKDYQLALDLYDTGIYDAMYLAGLIADDEKMTKKDLRKWVEKANCYSLREYTVTWVTAHSTHGWDMAREWIESKKESVASCGWAVFGGLVAITEDSDLDVKELKLLLKRVEKTIHEQPNRVRYQMNGFVIAVGSYVKELTELALATAGKIGTVTVNMGDTACKVPDAAAYIEKIRARGTIGKKKKTLKC
jgi:3-methyladenine DNA glycosylase AlkD